VYLDEFAHYARDREIYQSAVPVISKGGVIRIGSSPLGASGLFWEIFTQSMKPYPGYRRDAIPWWQVRALCKNVKKACRTAPGMLTDQRVHGFGSERLIQIYENMPLEDFQQEYECEWVDEAVAWIDWELIKRNQIEAQDGNQLYWLANGVDQAFEVIETVQRASWEGKIESVLVGAMDIGRLRDTSEITLLGKSTTNQVPFRCGITLDRVEFDEQAAVIDRLLERIPMTYFLMDQTGIGMQLSENAARKWPSKAIPFLFTNASKEMLAIEIKQRMQRAEVPLPAERDLMYQIHSVKKKITAAKNAVFDCDATEKHHADKFWSLAMAVYGDNPAISSGAVTVGENPLDNYRG
jgi:phage FluMu gp28-like protein